MTSDPASAGIEGVSSRSAADGPLGPWRVFLEHVWLVVGILLLAAVAGVVIVKRTPPAYQSRSVLMVDLGEQRFMKIEDVEKRENRSIEMLNTIASNIKGSANFKRVVAEAKMLQDPRIFPGLATNAPTEAAAMGVLAGAVDARLRRLTRLIDITVEHEHAEVAQFLAQMVADEFVKLNQDEAKGTGEQANEFLVKEAERLRAKLRLSEQAAQDYQATKSMSLSQGDNLIGAELKTINNRYSEAKSERHTLEVEFAQLDALKGQVAELALLPSVVRSPEVVAARDALAIQQRSVAELELRYKDKHPSMIQARAALAAALTAFELEVRNAPARLRREFELKLAIAREKEKGLETALREHESKVTVLAQQRIEFNRLQQEATLDREIYEAVLKRLRETDVAQNVRAVSRSDIRVAEPAFRPGVPIRPNPTRIIALSMFAGVAVSFGLLWLLQLADTSIKSVDHAERLLGIPVLGAIPRNKDIHDAKGRLFITDDPQSVCAEAFRTLRASLGLLGREEERKVVLFTSAIPSEGKTFCCVNYAIACAQQGKKTLLIDFDLRKPSLGESFDLPDKLPGATDVMLGRETLEKCQQPGPVENLFLLSSGTMVPNPAELLSGTWAKDLIQQAARQFDQVILDTAPINAVSDTLLMVKEAQTICLVTRAGKTPNRVVLRALEMLRRAGVKPSGAVLNFLPQSAGSGYYYYYSDKKYYGKGAYGKGAYGKGAYGKNARGQGPLPQASASRTAKKPESLPADRQS